MRFCNICGKPTQILIESHSLNIKQQRTGRRFFVCDSCHQNYHAQRNDWKNWGEKSAVVRKKKYHMNMGHVSLGFPAAVKKKD